MDKNMIESTSPTSLLLRTVDMFSLSMQFYGCSLSRTLMKAYAYIYNVTHTYIYIYIYIDGWVRIDISQLYTTISWMDFHSASLLCVGILLSTDWGPGRRQEMNVGFLQTAVNVNLSLDGKAHASQAQSFGAWSLFLLCCLLVDGFSKLSDRNGKCRIMMNHVWNRLFGTNL